MDTRYTYLPFDSKDGGDIRLLAFSSPSAITESNILSCHMLTTTLADAPPYSAISYTWGSASELRPILVDGLQLDIPKGTEVALRYLHSVGPNYESGLKDDAVPLDQANRSEQTSYFWIDAACINQKDKAECSRQIASMTTIYSQAQQVLIFLGSSFEGDSEVIQSMHRLVNRLKLESGSAAALNELLTGYSQHSAEIPLEDLVELDMHKVVTFFSSPWFTRLWVVQEALLSRTAFCFYGQKALPFMEMLMIAMYLKRLHYSRRRFRGKSIGTMENVDQLAVLYPMRRVPDSDWHSPHEDECRIGHCYGSIDLGYALAVFHDRENAEPRDKVYALLGLCKPAATEAMNPDYNEPLVDVYKKATKYMALKGSNGFDMLIRHARVLGNKDYSFYEQEKWPTWVACWDCPYDLMKNPSFITVIPGASASGDRKSRVTFGDDDTLTFEGYFFDSILTYSQTLDRTSIPNPEKPGQSNINVSVDNIQHAIDQADLLASHQLEYSPTGETFVTALGLTLVAGGRFEDSSEAEANFGAVLKYTKYRLLANHLSEAAKNKLAEGDPHDCLREFDIHTPFRKLFYTQNGYLGLGSHHLTKDDTICVPFGTRAPIIIRKVGAHYIFIGQCYVHGIMKGEFFANMKDEEQPQSFCIK